jgi:hypothetical protein
MALPVNSPSNEVVVHFPQMADVSAAATSVYAPAPVRGKVVRAYSVLGGAISAADCTWTFLNNAVAATGTATIAQASSAAGDIDVTPLTGAVNVNQGDKMQILTAGESSTTAVCDFYVVIRT